MLRVEGTKNNSKVALPLPICDSPRGSVLLDFKGKIRVCENVKAKFDFSEVVPSPGCANMEFKEILLPKSEEAVSVKLSLVLLKGKSKRLSPKVSWKAI